MLNIIYPHIKKHKKIISMAFLMVLVQQVFSLLDPQVFRIMIDNYITEYNTMSWNQFIVGTGGLLLLLMLIALVARISKHLQNYYVSATSQSVGAGVYAQSIESVLSLPYEVFEDERSGDLLEKLQKARTDLQSFIVILITMAFSLLVGVVFVLVYGFYVHPLIGFSYLLLVPVLTAVSLVMSRRIKKAQKEIVSETGSLAGATTETLRNIELVKSLGLEKREIDRLNVTNQKILALELKKVKTIRYLGFIQDTILNTLRSGILLLLFWLVFRGVVSVGNFFTLYIYSFFIFNPLSEIGGLAANYQEAKAGLEIVDKTVKKRFESAAVKPGTEKIQSIKSIEFANVSFGYKDSKKEVLNDVNIKATQGQTIAFVGPTGSGKTTMVKLLLGLYQIAKGKITINGIDINNIDYEFLRSRIGYVSQENQLFTGTVRENLLFVKPDATDKECEEVLALAQATTIIEKTGKGLETKIGEGGLKLSGGEKQRLAIARALLRQPNILIFDEATSNLDLLTEKSLTDTIKHIVAQKSDLITVMVAHRLSTVVNADTIYVLEKGRLAEQGGHTQLLANNGLYAALWHQQGVVEGT